MLPCGARRKLRPLPGAWRHTAPRAREAAPKCAVPTPDRRYAPDVSMGVAAIGLVNLGALTGAWIAAIFNTDTGEDA